MDKRKAILASIVIGCGIVLAVWMLICPSEVRVSIGEFPSKEAGLRAAIVTLAYELDRCPNAETYRIIWRGPNSEGSPHVGRRALLYLQEFKKLGYEHDILSGIDGEPYIVNQAAIKAVAEEGGTLQDFSNYDLNSK
jgi:hypothetical protein